MGRNLEGKVAIVTGSGQGVGRGIALCLAREGAKVITNNRKPGSASFEKYKPGDMTPEEYEEVKKLKGDAEATALLIRAEGGEAEPFYGSVSDFNTAKEMVEFAVKTYGRLDILVNNAAGLGKGNMETTSEADWEYLTAAKLKGAFNTMHFAVPIMKKQGFGRILNCASDAWTGLADLAAYSAGNAGVVGLTWSSAMEYEGSGITVNAYCPQADSPGHVVEFNKVLREIGVTKEMAAMNSAMQEAIKDHGPAENAAPFLAYLCTDHASHINGMVFSVTASGKINFYSKPRPVREIRKTESPWTVDELIRTVPEKLLFDTGVIEGCRGL